MGSRWQRVGGVERPPITSPIANPAPIAHGLVMDDEDAEAESDIARLSVRLVEAESDRLAEVEGLTAERDHYRAALHACVTRSALAGPSGTVT